MEKTISVLWLCNLPLPSIATAIGLNKPVFGGWLQGLADSIDKNTTKLSICFISPEIYEEIHGVADNIYYYALPIIEVIEKQVDTFSQILRLVEPDVIHIFGSEYVHSNSMTRACLEIGCINNVLLSIQGLVSVYAKHYTTGIPLFWKYYVTLRDFVYDNTGIYVGQRDFRKRGIIEENTIKKLKHISGRTDWDKACVFHINPDAEYHYCNETLRKSFYEHKWRLKNCIRHSIFISQGNYPVKGLHFMLEALPLILKHFPDTMVYVGGSDVVNLEANWKGSLLRESYGRYLLSLIKKYKLQNNIRFVGVLDETSMCNNFLSAHVFVSASTIENSPNSLGEAMILGVPVVSSDVGGVRNMIKHDEEGFIYQHDAPYMLAYYVMRIFLDDDLAERFSEKARAHAFLTHCKESNAETLIQIYHQIAGTN